MERSSAQPSWGEVPPQALIDPTSWSFNQQTLLKDGQISFSLYTKGGPVEIGGGTFGEQIIQTRPIDQEFQSFLITSIQRLDQILDIDFTISTTGERGEINFYLDEVIDIGSSDGTVLGIAINNYNSNQGGWWETLLNEPAFLGDRIYQYYASLHEVGHSLGLEHPFDASDGDHYDSEDPYLSARPEQTVMAYRAPISGSWPTWYQTSDLEALVSLYGKELQLFSRSDDLIIGEDYSEKLNGGQGEDRIHGNGGNDEIYGGRDDDWINGNQGDDVIHGNLGSDQLFGGKGHDWINGNQGNDVIDGNLGDDTLQGGQGNDKIFGGKDFDQLWGNHGDDWLDGGEGDDSMNGGFGADSFVFSLGHDVIIDFNLEEGDQIKIQSGTNFEIREVSGDLVLTVSENQSLSLQGISYNVIGIQGAISYF